MGVKRKDMAEMKACCLDAESGLYHFDHFQSVLDQELARLDHWGRPLSLAVLELPSMPPAAWAALGREVAASLRRIDLAARLGRTHLAVLMPDADENRARRWLADFLALIAVEAGLTCPAVHYGLALALPREGPQALDLLSQALENMGREDFGCLLVGGGAGENPATAIAADERSLLFDGFKSLGADRG